ncbi:MAG: I78 family peptidase inhibitor [Novosphingobium sp.]
MAQTLNIFLQTEHLGRRMSWTRPANRVSLRFGVIYITGFGMRAWVFICAGLALAFAGAVSTPAQMVTSMSRVPKSPASSTSPGGQDICKRRLTDRFLGQKYNSAVRSQLSRAVMHDRIRLVRAGEAVTPDYRPDRLNLIVDRQETIMAIRCG